ncbi:hypothetical protein EDB80DRAFT_687145 [Ilyonectria destructans]|nr:hypothetical protein EDB80DRAFT_687145 [Ilyonectria destructans]
MIAQKVAIITGGSTGMGNAVAVDLAKQGWKVVILDINHEAGEQAASEINGHFFKADVRSWMEQFKAFERTFELFGRLDFVFGNAGKADVYDYFDSEGTDFNIDTSPNLEVLDINLTGASFTSLLALRAFRRNPKDVKDCLLVLTSSGAGIYPTPVQPFYAAAKHGIIGLARSMGQRHKEEGIRVCALVPGLVPTTIMPKEILDRTDKCLITPVSHIVTAINDMLNGEHTATVCEASVDKLFYRNQPSFPDEAQRRVILEVSKNMGDDFKKVREK